MVCLRAAFSATAVALFISFEVGSASASLLQYELTVTKPLRSGSDTIGGFATPVIFDFSVDSDALNVGGCDTSMEAVYLGIDATVRIGREVSRLHNVPSIRVADDGASNDVFEAVANTYDDRTRVNGQSLFVVGFSIRNSGLWADA